MKKPVIGITCPWSQETWGDSPVHGGHFYAGHSYVHAVAKYGGIPVLIPCEYEENDRAEYIAELMDTLDGVLFTGGGNVKRPAGAKIDTLRLQQPVRYDFEEALLKTAVEQDKPVIGICRGFQMILETFGGSLAEELVDGHKQNTAYYETWHPVNINPESKLYQILSTEKKDVNSIHVQKAEAIPQGFIAAAVAEDGVVESVEHAGDKFVLGYQFHPEELARKYGEFGKIFELFMAEAVSRRKK